MEKWERWRGRILEVRHPEKVERRRRRIPGVRHPDGMAAEGDSGCETPGWNGGGGEFRV